MKLSDLRVAVLGEKREFREIEEVDVYRTVGDHEKDDSNVLFLLCSPRYFLGLPWDDAAKRLGQHGYNYVQIAKGKTLLPKVKDFVKLLRERGYKFDEITGSIINASERGGKK